MSSIDRIKRKRKELEIERSDVSNINKSIGKINILRDEISTTGGIDYGDIAPIRTNSNTNNVSNNVSTDLNALQEKRKSLQSQLVNYERKKNDDYWWDKDKNIISNIGNVAKKLFVDSDRKNKYAKDDKYDSLLKEYNDTIKAIETVSLDNKTYKGFSGSVDKVSDTILGNAVTSRKGIESTVKKILGQTPTDEESTLTYEEMLAQKARQETTGAGGVGLDILGSVTRMLPQMMVGNSTGALAMGFANYGGSAYNQARQEGATEKQATAYGVISGSLEMMLNKILPSYNIGGKNVYGKTLTDNIMNQVVTNSAFKNFVFRTVNDAAGEFTEEYLQEFLEPIIKNTVLQQDNGADFWNTMKDDVDKGLKQLGSQLFNKENLYAGSLGALTSGIMGFQSNTDAYRYEKRTGRNAETGLTANEQSVMNDEVNKRTVEAQKKAAVDSEVNKIIKEQEKTFGTLTDAEKAGIKNQVQEKLDNGEIDFTTLKLKNSEIKTIENRVKEDLQKGYIDIDTIENTLTQEKTVQIKELEQRLRNIANEQEKTQIEEKLNQLRIDRANDLKNKLRQDIYLQESYAELARKSEKFTYEAKKTDSEIKKNLAEDFKKIANNTNKSHETFETISKIAEDRGVSYGVINNEQLKQLGYDIEGKNVNGLVRTMQDGKQKVLVNLDSDKAINTIVGHETTHLLEGTKEYTNFQEYIKNYAKTKGEYNTRYKELSNLYRGVNANIETEVTADLVGDYLFTDTDFVRNLSVESPTIFKQVYDYIKHVYNLATAGSKEKRQLEQVKYKFEEAYRQSNVQVNDGIQYSMIGEKGALNATNINSKNQFLLTNLEKAKSMAKSGKSNDEIFKATGWFKQYGKWKFEISDSILDGVTINNVKKNHEYLLSDILNHKDLFIAYENLKNTKVSFADLKNYNGYMVGGQYDAKKKNIELNNKLLDTKNPDKAIKQVLMHEVQHKIQQYEGFKNGSTGLLGEEAYKRSKGEIESRETEKRLEMSYEQRNNKIPEAVHSRMDSIPELLYNKFGKEKSVYDNNIDTDSIVDINGDFINKKSNEILEGSDAERIFRGNRKKQKELDNSSFSLDQRVSGDALLDAQDFIDEVKSVGAEVDDNGYVTVYHQTSDENADKIRQSGKMIANEDYVYFSTSKNATQSEGRGQTKLEFKIPAEKLMLDDIFSDNADVKIPLKGKKTLDVSNYLVNDTKYSISDTDNKGRTLSNQNEIAPRNSNLTYGEDIKFQEKPVIEEISPVKVEESPVKTGNAPEGYNALTEEDLPYLEQQYNETPREDTAPPKPEIDAEDSGIPMRRVKPEQTVNDEIARILTEEPKKQDTRNKRKWAIFKANVLDKGSVFEDLSLKAKNRDLMGKWDYTLSSQARAQNVIGNGHTEYDAVTKTTKQTSKSLNDIRAEVDNTGMTQDFYNYMYHKHNVDRMNLSNRFEGVENKPVFGEGITSEISQQIVNEYENAHPEFIDYANDVYDYVNADRQQLVNEGVISQETADLWQEMYPHYVPIRRVDKNGVDINVPLDTRRTGVNAPIKKATGGSSDILPLFDTMAMRTLQTYRATAKNSFGVELKNTLNTNTEVNKTNVDEVIDSVDNQEGLLQEGKNGKNPTFTVFVNGEKVTYDITQDMYDALKPISDSSILSKTFTPFNAVSNFHRGVLTQYNLFFALTNAVKDAQDVLMNSQHAAKTYSKIPEAWSQQLKKGYWYQEYMANGGEQNSYFDSRDNTFNPEKKGLYKLTDMFPLKTIATINDFIEMTPRLAEYIASREAGRSIEVSMLDAARVTTNFKAGGDLTKWANRNGATFLNASVQGFNQQIRNIREANAKGLNGWATLATKFAVAGLPALLLNALLWGDDDDYEELSDYVKQNYYIVAKYGDGEFIRIPKGRTLAVIQNAMEQVQKASKGDEEADFKEFISLFLNNLAPNNPIENNVLSPIIQAATNKAWYGGDLVPTRLQDMPTAEQYDESTDTFSKWLGEKLNVSPYKINYVMNQYTGFLGDMFMPMMTPEAKNDADSVGDYLIAPLKDKFTADSTMNNKYTGELFETSEELTTNSRKSNVTDEDVLKNKFINSMKREMNELYKQKREIQNSNLSKSEKYNQVREIQKEINELSKYGLDNYKDVQITGNYATVGNREYRLTTNTEGEETWNKITDKQKAKQEEVSNALGINASDYWGNKEEYDYAYENPGNYGISKVIGGYETFKAYSKELNDIKSDKDSNGKTIANSRKQKVFDYINSTDLNFEQRVMLAKLEYPSYDEYNNEIIEYLNNNKDISYEEEVEILKQLGFEVDSYGNISW